MGNIFEHDAVYRRGVVLYIKGASLFIWLSKGYMN